MTDHIEIVVIDHYDDEIESEPWWSDEELDEMGFCDYGDDDNDEIEEDW